MNQSTNRKAKNGAIPSDVKMENDLKQTRNNLELWISIGKLEERQNERGE